MLNPFEESDHIPQAQETKLRRVCKSVGQCKKINEYVQTEKK